MGNISKAIRIAAEVHEHQTDKGGEEYVLHAIEVMRMAERSILGLRFSAPNFREDVMVVAVLHDTVEDFEGSPGERARFHSFLRAEFGGTIMAALDAMTHDEDESYADYIERVSKDPIARIVKMADLAHNMDPTRLPEGDIGDREYQRWDKYRKSLVRLRRED
jgi:(p)ppGpp synthase/HD superfamily hydrolase